MTSSITLSYSLSGSNAYESQLIMLTTATNCVKCSISWNKDIAFIVNCSIGSWSEAILFLKELYLYNNLFHHVWE